MDPLEPGRAQGTLYDAFLALGIYQDVGVPMPAPAVLGAAMHELRTPDGGFSCLTLRAQPSVQAH